MYVLIGEKCMHFVLIYLGLLRPASLNKKNSENTKNKEVQENKENAILRWVVKVQSGCCRRCLHPGTKYCGCPNPTTYRYPSLV
jgi:hypothetical protein